MTSDEFLANAHFLALAAIGAYLPVWAFRRRRNLDLPQSTTSRLIRWTTILISWVCAAWFADVNTVRNIAFTLGLVMLCWPNLAVRASAALSRNRNRAAGA